jgi:hypothetical protein
LKELVDLIKKEKIAVYPFRRKRFSRLGTFHRALHYLINPNPPSTEVTGIENHPLLRNRTPTMAVRAQFENSNEYEQIFLEPIFALQYRAECVLC